MKARIAWFVMAHHRPEQLRWVVEALASSRTCELILLHVDLKSLLGIKPERNGVWRMARRLAAEHPAVRLLSPRFTNWGGWSLTRLHLHAVETALALDPGWTHFVNLSGQCYPIKPLDEIRAALGRADDQIFVELRPFASLPQDDWHLAWHPMIELPHKALKLPGPRRKPTGFALDHKGSQWSILPRRFCEWQREAPIGREIRRYLRHLLLSDELIMQTLALNGPWRERVAPHFGREIVWPGPKVFGTADLPQLLESPGFFARKFDMDRDPEVLGTLARRLGLPLVGPET
ncbi:MAG: hypothetical protein J2P47_05840 [Acetobacteraceae bacterium]|nr:hypothetical protein [Acetobacteraceae bacterium]